MQKLWRRVITPIGYDKSFNNINYTLQGMKISFNMNRLNITDGVLNTLGFSEYHDGAGDYGTRTLTFSDGTRFTIVEQNEVGGGNYYEERYLAHSYYFCDWAARPALKTDISIHRDLFFITDMWECIKEFYPHCVKEFESNLKGNYMWNYVDDYKKDPSSQGYIVLYDPIKETKV